MDSADPTQTTAALPEAVDVPMPPILGAPQATTSIELSYMPNRGAGPLEPDAPQTRAAWALRWGQLLRTARQVSGLTLAEVSALSGLSKGYLSKLESGAPAAVNPSRATLAALARALPAFRPLAHALESASDTADLDYTGIAPHPNTSAQPDSHDPDRSTIPDAIPEPVLRLGWRELELMAALVALESAAIPFSITSSMLARASGRASAEVMAALHRLVAQRMVVADLPVRPGGSATYHCAPDAAARIGITRLGDVLVLAAMMLIRAPVLANGRGDHVRDRSDTAPESSAAESEHDGK